MKHRLGFKSTRSTLAVKLSVTPPVYPWVTATLSTPSFTGGATRGCFHFRVDIFCNFSLANVQANGSNVHMQNQSIKLFLGLTRYLNRTWEYLSVKGKTQLTCNNAVMSITYQYFKYYLYELLKLSVASEDKISSGFPGNLIQMSTFSVIFKGNEPSQTIEGIFFCVSVIRRLMPIIFWMRPSKTK